jgi:hypothetical protein
MTKKKPCPTKFQKKIKNSKTEFFQNFIFFSKYKDEVIFCSTTNLVLNLDCNFGEILEKMSI